MIARRSFLARTTIATSAMLSPQVTLAASDPRQDLVVKLDPLESMVRLRSRIDGELSMAWLTAEREIVFDGQLYPFCTMYNLMLTSFRKEGDAYISPTYEVSYYCHPITGALLDAAMMPGLRDPIEVPIYRAGPSDVRYKALQDEWSEVPTSRDATSKVHHLRTIDAPKAIGDKAFLKADEYVRVYPGSSATPSVFYRDWMIWQARVDDLLDPDNPDVASSFSYGAATDLRPWMKLDPSRGHTLASGVGAKVQDAQQLPARLVELLQEHDPKTLDAPQSYFS